MFLLLSGEIVGWNNEQDELASKLLQGKFSWATLGLAEKGI